LLTIDVCAAVIIDNSRFLLATRPPNCQFAGLWEFPGGKQNLEETRSECIIREIAEELTLTITNPTYLTTIIHQYTQKTINLHFMLCQLAIPKQKIHCCQQQQAKWFNKKQLNQIKLVPADKTFIKSFDFSTISQ